jgi:hypothetical protein
MWESWATGLRSQLTHEFGFFNDSASFEASRSGALDQQLRLDAYAHVALSNDASVFIVIPWLFPRIALSDGVHTGSNLSDLQIGYRHQVIAIGEYEELPSLALTASILLPTGASERLPNAPHLLTGRDLLALMTGVSLEKTWMPFFAQLNLGGSLLINGVRSRGPRFGTVDYALQVTPAAGVELSDELVLSMLSQWLYESPHKYRTQIGAAASWRFNPHFTLQANVNTDVMIQGFGANWPGAFSCGVGLRYGYF